MGSRTEHATFPSQADEWAALDCDEFPDLVPCDGCGENYDRTYAPACPNGCEADDE